MALVMDISVLVGAFKAIYEGPHPGLWYPEVAGKPFDIATQVGVYPGLDSVSGLAAYSGTRQKNNPAKFSQTLTNAEYEDSIEIAAPDLRADLLGLYSNAVADMAQKAQFHWNTLTVAKLAAGHNTACQDGQYFFDTDHPYGSSSTQKNLVTASDVATLAVVDKTKPTAIEMSNLIMDCTAYFHSLRDKAGDTINGNMRRIIIVTGDFKKFASIQAALSQDNLTGAVTNPLKAGLISTGYQFVPVFETALTGDSIYFLRADSQIKPIILQENGPLDFDTLGEGSEYFKANKKALFGIYGNRAAGYGRYQSALKATLSNAA